VRKTLTIDEDVARLLEQESKRSGESFKGTVNRLLRLGVIAARAPQPAKPFKIKARALGLKRGYSYDSIPELLEKAEGPHWQ
jgi:hypothetical protein